MSHSDNNVEQENNSNEVNALLHELKPTTNQYPVVWVTTYSTPMNQDLILT